MKKAICFLLVSALCLSLIGCTRAEYPVPPEPKEPEAADPADITGTSDNDTLWLPYDENGRTIYTNRDATGSQGAVSSTSWYASKAGLNILEAGGSAVDAAIAVSYTLGVVEPYTSGIGGGGFMTIYDAASGKVTMLDFREMAPSDATADMYLDDNGEIAYYADEDGNAFTGVYSRLNRMGGLAVAVPGQVAGLEYALSNFGSGTFTRAELMADAISYAREGWLVTPTMYNSTQDEYKQIAGMEDIASYYLDEYKFPYDINATVINNDLADTLELIAQGGSDAFYSGPVAEAIADAVKQYGGLLTLEDLANYTVAVREPLVSTYRDYTIYALPPSSSGGTHLLEILNILENYDMSSLDVNNAEYVHLFAEAMKIAFADKDAYMADTAFAEVPLEELTSKEYAAARAAQFSDGNGSYDAGELHQEHGSTTSFSVVDAKGNMVTCTQTIGDFYGSKVAVAGYGFILNDEMYDFDTDPESVNCAEGGKRPLSSMAPTVVLYPDGSPYVTIGTPGGTRIFSVIAQVIERMIDFDLDIQQAIEAVRIFNSDAESLAYESEGAYPLSDEDLAALEGSGYVLNPKDKYDLYFGGVQGIAIMKDGTIRAGADPRRSGKALAY